MRRTWIILFLAILTPLLLLAKGDKKEKGTGRISGTVTDSATGDPVIGASILIVGTQRGGQTDFDGNYTVFQVEPGVYTMRISHLEYRTVEVTDVPVTAGMTTNQSIGLTKKTDEMDKSISVIGTRDKLEIREVSNQQRISKEEIAHRPVTTVDELLSGVAGVVTNKKGKAYIRGGRAGEVSYIVDGVPLDPPGGGLAHGGSAIVNGEAFDAMFFKNYGVNPFVDADDDHLSTFAIDVDDASYIMTRSYLESGNLPPSDAVRVEEFVNHFSYGYPAPRRAPFQVYIDGAPSVFGGNTQLVRIGIKGREIREEQRKPANLVFVIDVSGSMDRGDRLGLVRQSLSYLVDQLDERDRVGIVVYGSRGEVLLHPTSIDNRRTILRAIDRLVANGSTNAEEGIRLGYEMANRMFEAGKINRVILCSDGVANVGQTGPDEILKQIKRYAEKGITLTTVGFGMGNYNDVLMEKLGNKGNGFYAYVEDIDDARRIFVDNLTGTLEVIARDVKIQVDFDPAVVRSYRLLGYENRDVADEKFRDDREDGGEIGSGHQVTALYEVKLWGERSSGDNGYRPAKQYRDDRSRPDRGRDTYDEQATGYVDARRLGSLGTVYIRYKDPDHNEVSELRYAIDTDSFAYEFRDAHSDLKLAAAAAEFSEILRKSYWAKEGSLEEVQRLVQEIRRENNSEEVSELLALVKKAQRYEDQLAQK